MSFAECGCWQSILRSELCPSCWKDLSTSFYSRYVYFQLAGVPLLSVSKYDSSIKRLIAICKKSHFNGLTPALENFLQQMTTHWSRELAELEAETIVTVPGHPLRSRLQSDLAWLMAAQISQELKLSPPQKIFHRPLETESFFWSGQKYRNRSERLDHYEKFPMKLKKNLLLPRQKQLLLVDDVSTTGATLAACVEALRAASYKVAGIFVLSRVELEMGS